LHWLWAHLGLGNGNSAWYLWPSGWGSILIPPLLTAAPIVWVLLRKHNCHVHGCWRVGRHPVEGTPFTVCRRHDPAGTVTEAEVRRRYHLYLGKQPGRG
jgi:hypothetical protein